MTTDCTPTRISCPTPMGARPTRIEAGLRNPDRIVHEKRPIVGRRMPGLIGGLEDLNDRDEFGENPVPGVGDSWRGRMR